ncbi:MAG: glycosyltransferase [Myxococcota bacterium]
MADLTASFVIPVYNEEGLLTSAVHALIVDLQEQMPDLSYEIVLTENGSSDDTLELAYELERHHEQVRALHSPEPNYGKALRRGIFEARGTYVLCDEIDICDVGFHKRALAILEADQADMVIGSKAHADAVDARPLFRRAATSVLNGMLRVLLDFHGTDTHGLKAFHRERLLSVVSQCIVDKDIFASEFVIRAERQRYRILEIPVTIHEKRPPSVNLFKRVPHVLRSIARLTWAIRVQARH